jgi:hypothetical protein
LKSNIDGDIKRKLMACNSRGTLYGINFAGRTKKEIFTLFFEDQK